MHSLLDLSSRVPLFRVWRSAARIYSVVVAKTPLFAIFFRLAHTCPRIPRRRRRRRL